MRNYPLIHSPTHPLIQKSVRLQDLTLLQFKNYEEAALSFSAHINCFTGPNGSGKTNLLDAIHYLCMTRSAFTGNDQQNILQGSDYFMVRGTFIKDVSGDIEFRISNFENGESETGGENLPSSEVEEPLNTSEPNFENSTSNTYTLDDTAGLSLTAEPGADEMSNPLDKPGTRNTKHETSPVDPFRNPKSEIRNFSTHQIACTVRLGQKKIITHNRVPYERASEHIGQYPVVLVSPFDTDLIREGSEERRKLFDSLLSQLDPTYLRDLILYTQLLKQRNTLLKQFADRNHTDLDLLAVIDEQLLGPGERIAGTRLAFIARFEPLFRKHYEYLAGGSEQVSIVYNSQLTSATFSDLLHQNQRKDLALQRSTTGPHRDDYLFLMDNLPVKSYGSQGQQKSFVIALKLAQFEVIAHDKGYKPLLLLDDIFDRLDEQRIERLLQLVAAHTFGQLFITDTHPGRTLQLLNTVAEDLRHFTVQKGMVSLQEK